MWREEYLQDNVKRRTKFAKTSRISRPRAWRLDSYSTYHHHAPNARGLKRSLQDRAWNKPTAQTVSLQQSLSLTTRPPLWPCTPTWTGERGAIRFSTGTQFRRFSDSHTGMYERFVNLRNTRKLNRGFRCYLGWPRYVDPDNARTTGTR